MAVDGGKEDGFEPGPLEDAWRIFDARHLPYRLLMLGKMLDRLASQQVRDHAGMSIAEWRVLAHLAVMGSKSASEVSAAALVDRAEVSRAVRALEESSFLTRIDNPRNRKSSLLVLTPLGQETFRRVSRQRRDFYSALTADIAPQELDLLDGLLLRMARQADRLAREEMAQGRRT
jgi:DNA-binding MarR family transcriptional regulator